MKREKTIRQRLFPIFALATGIPIILFALAAQYRLRSSLNENIEMQIKSSLESADRSLDMIIEKYDILLTALCEDEAVAEAVEAGAGRQGTETGTEMVLEKALRDICKKDEGIGGVSLIHADGQKIRYDAGSDSFTKSSESDGTGEEERYSFQMMREVPGGQETDAGAAKMVFDIREKALAPVLEAGEKTEIYLLCDGEIIASRDEEKKGKEIREIRQENFRYNELKNEAGGFTICSEYSLKMYHRMLGEQRGFWIMITVGAICVLLGLSYILTLPYLRKIAELAEAMNEVEKGKFNVEVPIEDAMPLELNQISGGFNEMVRQIDRLIGQVKGAVIEQKNAELSALEAQIDPHFLYNTLDTINWKAIQDGNFEVSEMVGALADILRYTVKNAGAETSLEQEIYWLGHYTLLQKAKLGKELTVEVLVPEELYPCKIHKLLLQPFVENAMKHGVLLPEGELHMKVSVRPAGSQLHIMIEDNGRGIDEETLRILNSGGIEEYKEFAGEHVGIINVRKRLKLYYGDQADLYFESEKAKYTKVHLFIPKIIP